MPRILIRLAAILLLLFAVASLWLMLPVQPITSWETGLPSNTPASNLLVSANGKVLAAVGNGRIILWDIASHEEQASIAAVEEMWIGEVHLAPDGRSVIYQEVGQRDYVLKLWRINQGGPAVIPSLGYLNLVQFTGDSQLVLVEGYSPHNFERKAVLWDLATGKGRPTPWDPAEVRVAKCLPDGTLLAFENRRYMEQDRIMDGLMVWDVATQRIRFRLAGQSTPVAICNDGKLLATFSKDGIKLWDLPGSSQNGIKLWHLATGLEADFIQGDHFVVDCHGSRLRAHVFGTDRETLWDVSQAPARKVFSFATQASPHKPMSYPAVFSPDGNWQEMEGNNRTTEVWDGNTGDKKIIFDDKFANETFAPDSRTISAIDRTARESTLMEKWIWRRQPRSDPSVKVWDLATGQVLATFDGFRFAYLPDGKAIAIITEDGTIQIWDLPPRRPLWVEYGLPALFTLLLFLGAWYCLRMRRQMQPTVDSPGEPPDAAPTR